MLADARQRTYRARATASSRAAAAVALIAAANDSGYRGGPYDLAEEGVAIAAIADMCETVRLARPRGSTPPFAIGLARADRA